MRSLKGAPSGCTLSRRTICWPYGPDAQFARYARSFPDLQFLHPLLELAVLVLQLLERVAQLVHLIGLRRAFGQGPRHLAGAPTHAPVEILELGPLERAHRLGIAERAQRLDDGDAGAKVGIVEQLDHRLAP